MQYMEGGGQTGACPPPPRKKKKRLSKEILISHLCFTNEIRGGIDTLYMQNGRGWADKCVSMVRGGGGLAPPPPFMKLEKKRLSKEILISFTYILLHFHF